MAFPVKANELKPHLEGKKVVYVGSCWFDKNGVITFNKNEKKFSFDCVVGMVLPDQTKHYILIYVNNKPVKLVMYDETTKKQVTLWVANAI